MLATLRSVITGFKVNACVMMVRPGYGLSVCTLVMEMADELCELKGPVWHSQHFVRIRKWSASTSRDHSLLRKNTELLTACGVLQVATPTKYAHLPEAYSVLVQNGDNTLCILWNRHAFCDSCVHCLLSSSIKKTA